MASYAAELVTVAWGPGLILNAFADGTFVEAERNEVGFSQSVGASGEVCRNKMGNKTGTIKLRLLQSSSQNDVLSEYALLDDTVGGQVYPIAVRDLSGTSLAEGEKAYIQKIPKLDRAKEIGSTEWIFLVDNIMIFNGGILAP